MMFTILLLLGTLSGSLGQYRSAMCDLQVNSATPDIDDQVTGTVYFTQDGDGEVTVDISLAGFNTDDENVLHGFHVHQIGDLSEGCDSTGGHFNPEGVNHGAPDADVRHVGDLGNIEEDENGYVVTSFTDSYISLSGDYNIIGRAVNVHQNADDLGLGGDDGSITHGNAGPRISCCIIEEVSGK